MKLLKFIQILITGVRDYIHIMDLAEGHWAAAKKLLGKDGPTGSIFNMDNNYID